MYVCMYVYTTEKNVIYQDCSTIFYGKRMNDIIDEIRITKN